MRLFGYGMDSHGAKYYDQSFITSPEMWPFHDLPNEELVVLEMNSTGLASIATGRPAGVPPTVPPALRGMSDRAALSLYGERSRNARYK